MIVYLDDILILNELKERAMEDLGVVVSLLQQLGFLIN